MIDVDNESVQPANVQCRHFVKETPVKWELANHCTTPHTGAPRLGHIGLSNRRSVLPALLSPSYLP